MSTVLLIIQLLISLILTGLILIQRSDFNIENQNTSLIDDTNAVAPLTAPVDSPDTTNPLADETSTAESPTLEATPEVAEEPKKDE